MDCKVKKKLKKTPSYIKHITRDHRKCNERGPFHFASFLLDYFLLHVGGNIILELRWLDLGLFAYKLESWPHAGVSRETPCVYNLLNFNEY